MADRCAQWMGDGPMKSFGKLGTFKSVRPDYSEAFGSKPLVEVLGM